jgi:hypothetical protein
MLPPPPFLVACDSLAALTFTAGIHRNLTTGQYDLEITRLSDNTVCWSHGFQKEKTAKEQYTSVVVLLRRLNVGQFADFCERRLGTVISVN